jgi:hypothetical protein
MYIDEKISPAQFEAKKKQEEAQRGFLTLRSFGADCGEPSRKETGGALPAKRADPLRHTVVKSGGNKK